MDITLGVADRSKPGVDEGSRLVLSGGSFGVTWVVILESAGTGDSDPLGSSKGIRVGNKVGISVGEVMVITLGVADRSKLGCEKLSGQVLLGRKFKVWSLVELLCVEVGTEVGPCDGMSHGRDLWNIVVGSWTRKMDGYLLVESLGAEYGAEGGSYGEISGG